MKIARSALTKPSIWIGALCAVLLGSLFHPGSAMAMGPPGSFCSSNYDADVFRVCFFSGTDPAAGTYLGEEFEPSLGNPVSPRAFGIDRDWGSGEIFGGLSGDISAVWRGRLNFGDDRHLLTVFSSDGVRVYIDEELVLDEWGNTSVDTYVVAREGLLGIHDIRIEWFEAATGSSTRAHLRFHWDKVPDVYDALVPSPIKIDVFILKEMQVCIAGVEHDHDPVEKQVRLRNGNGDPDLAWQTTNVAAELVPKIFKASDEMLIPPELTQVECLSFGFSYSEVADLQIPGSPPVFSFADSIAEWTFGALQPTIEFHEIDPRPFSMGKQGAGLWFPWNSLEDAASRFLTPETDFVIALTSNREVNPPDPGNIRSHYLGSRGSNFPFDDSLNGTGTGYSWIPQTGGEARDREVMHEWDHQVGAVIKVLLGGDVTDQPLVSPPVCDNQGLNPLEWYGNPDHPILDPDSPWCGFPDQRGTDFFNMQRAFTSHNLVHHFDPSLMHYTLTNQVGDRYLTGNHCDNGILDDGNEGSLPLGENPVDLGASCHLPSVSISSPADGSSFGSGNSISFAGVATALIEGDLTADLAWNSDLEMDPLGTGGSVVTSVLSIGTHEITASAVDSGGSAGSATITITVAPVPFLLSANGYKKKGKHTVDLSWSGAAGNVVDVYRDGALVEDNTANDGAHTDAIGAKGSATYEYQVCEEAPLTNCSPIVTVVF